MRFFRKIKKKDVSFEEILLDSSNLPSFNVQRMEGRIELPLAKKNIILVGIGFVIIVLIFLFQIFKLQVITGSELATKSENNRLDFGLIVAERGVVYDKHGELVVWNEIDTTKQYDFPVRAYTDRRGVGQLIGYVSYPQKDSSGIYFRTEYIGRSGIEEAYEELLHGENGRRLMEVNALGEVISESAVNSPVSEKKLHCLSILNFLK